MAEEPASTRAQALAGLIPPLAHRLNNLLALGVAEIDLRSEHPEVVLGPERRAQAAAAVASLEEAGRLIRSLARFARGPLGERPADVDARELLREVGGLCTPAANEHGVPLALEQRGERALFEADGSALSEALVLLLMTLIIEPGTRPARLRLLARASRGRLVLSVAAAGRFPAAPPGADRALARFAELAGARFRARTSRAAAVWSVALAARTFPGQVSARQRGVRVALCMPDELLADLVTSVLEEEGHKVVRARRMRDAALLLDSTSVLFVDTEAEAEEPELFARVVRSASAALILGAPRQPAPAGCIVLAKPVRPGELLAALAELRTRNTVP